MDLDPPTQQDQAEEPRPSDVPAAEVEAEPSSAVVAPEVQQQDEADISMGEATQDEPDAATTDAATAAAAAVLFSSELTSNETLNMLASPAAASPVDDADDSLQAKLEAVEARLAENELKADEELHNASQRIAELEAQAETRDLLVADLQASQQELLQKNNALQEELQALKDSITANEGDRDDGLVKLSEVEKDKRELLAIVERLQGDKQESEGKVIRNYNCSY